MAKYNIKYDDLQNQADSLKNISKTLASFESRLNSIINSMDARNTSIATLQKQTKECCKPISSASDKVSIYGSLINIITATYKNAEISQTKKFAENLKNVEIIQTRDFTEDLRDVSILSSSISAFVSKLEAYNNGSKAVSSTEQNKDGNRIDNSIKITDKEINSLYESDKMKSWKSWKTIKFSENRTSSGKVNCTWYTYQRLYNIYDKKIIMNGGGNGNQWVKWDNNGKYVGTVASTDTQVPFKGTNALSDIVNEYGQPVQNIIVSFTSSPKNGTKYGHVMLIDAIIDGKVYYSDSDKPGVLVTKTIAEFVNYYKKYNGDIQGAVVIL